MRIEKWIYKGEEVDVPILSKEEVEENVDITELEQTKDLTNILKDIEEKRG